MAIIRDITVRKQLERQLIESEKKYRTLVENDPNMIFFIKERVLTFVNQSFLDTLGYSKEELFAPTYDFFANIISEQREMFREHLTEILDGEDMPASFELYLMTKKGEIVPCLANITSFEMEGKQVIQGVLTDIRKIKELEKEVMESEERYRGLYESSVDGIVSYDLERNIIECNQSFADMHGYSKEELLQLTLWDLIYEKWHDIPEKIRAEVLEKGYSEEFETEHIRKDGKIFPVSLRVWPIKAKNGRLTGMWGIVRDITERKKAEDALKLVAYNLRERVKELRCFYNISELVDKPDILLEEILQGVVELIPPAWQYPESTCTRIIIEDKEFRTENFRETIWKQASDIIVHGNRIGALEVFYLEKMPDSNEGPFLKEERSLINAIAERVGKIITRKQAEEQLKDYTQDLEKMIEERTKELSESEERLKAILTGIGDLITIQNKNLEIIWANQAIKDIWGDIIGKKCHEVYKCFDEPCPQCTVEAVFNEGKTFVSEQIVIDPDGKLMNTLVTSSPVRDADGNIVAAVEVVKDITERKQAEEALQKSEASLAEAQRIAHLGNWDWNILTNELHWSDEIYRIFGLAPQEFGATYEAFLNSVHPEDREFVRKSVDRALYDDEPYSIDHRIVLPDGEVRIVHEQADITFDETGRPIRMVGTVQEITEQKKLNKQLVESEERYRGLYESSIDGIVSVDQEDHIVECNQAFAEMLGYSKDELHRLSTSEITPSEWHDMVAKIIAEQVQTRGYSDEFETKLLKKDGTVFPVSARIWLIKDKEGNPSGMWGIVRKINERK